MKYSEVHYFADGSNLLNFNSLVKSINKQVNHDRNNFKNWLKTNKTSLNVGTAELVLFTSLKKAV